MAGAIYGTNLSQDFTGTNALNSLVNSVNTDYNQRYAPIQHDIARIAYGTNFGDVMNDVNAEGAIAARGVDSSEAGYRRGLAAQGGVGESASAVRQFGLRRVLAQVDSMNRTSQSARARQEAAQAYGLDQATAGVGLQSDILSQIARGETDRYAQYTGAKANAKAAGTQATGQAIGTALTVAAMFM